MGISVHSENKPNVTNGKHEHLNYLIDGLHAYIAASGSSWLRNTREHVVVTVL